ncbi:hypothetical protein GUY44_12085 [Pimelobacter simplex]|uniref:Uncharacterized protein n=1 Tax=Nocardioides simplex TaxID=2045 RepID=A0A0A1DLB1_NOCSI|nr:hypothetical protein [Pimelobacter simplex]AIY16160.3 hypothetical protein KR76_04205 [Pimelobacter simplex]MCG8151222.1 hypothetical protein [Pimelobacter simplex]GEB17183.1 hypothetical protein NSI01_54980 [Pimelobacter simplex]SFN19038.1 hypothetical protein SAMN05421671_0038 [Pimelobacter simplex]
MDISETLAPKSDQLDAVELAAGPRTFTVKRVAVNAAAEQPVSIFFEEFDRPWRPGRNQRRVLAFCWGKSQNDAYVGRRVTLFYDPDVMYGGRKVGGARISHLSHIDGPMQAPVLESQGRPGVYPVDPLPDAPTPPSEAAIACAADKDQLREWHRQFPTLRESILARVAEIDAQPTEDGASE